MLSHFEIGGTCNGKMIRQSRKAHSRSNLVCNKCDLTISEDTAKRLARRKTLHQKRKNAREASE